MTIISIIEKQNSSEDYIKKNLSLTWIILEDTYTLCELKSSEHAQTKGYPDTKTDWQVVTASFIHGFHFWIKEQSLKRKLYWKTFITCSNKGVDWTRKSFKFERQPKRIANTLSKNGLLSTN